MEKGEGSGGAGDGRRDLVHQGAVRLARGHGQRGAGEDPVTKDSAGAAIYGSMIETRDTLAARLAAAARGAFGVVAALGAGALWGWALGVPFLRDLGADFAPMPPAGALAFLLLAGSFFAAQRGKDAAATRWRRTAFAAALTAGLIAALTLLEDFAGPPLGMTFRWLAGRGGGAPALLSPAVCITLLVLAAAAPLSREVRIGKLSLNAAAGTLVAATG